MTDWDYDALGSIRSSFTSDSFNKPLEHRVLPTKDGLTRRQRKCGSFQGKMANDWIVVTIRGGLSQES